MKATFAPAGLPGPESLEESPRALRLGGQVCASLFATGFPSEVSADWLAPLLNYPGSLDVAIHAIPEPNDTAFRYLKGQLGGHESTKLIERARGRLVDPRVESAADQTAALMARLARGEARMFWSGIYLTVWADDGDSLQEEVRRVSSLAASMSLEVSPATFRATEGWLTTLPLGLDLIDARVPFDTDSLACVFPFASSDIDGSAGILYGRNLSTGSLVFADPFAQEIFNQVLLAESGRGKSYLTKLLVLRSLLRGTETLVVDPENEYVRLAESTGGTVACLGADGDRINPLEITADGTSSAFFEQALFTESVVETLLGGLSSEEKAVLDAAVSAAYGKSGITADPQTHRRPAPLLADVAGALANAGGQSLGTRLRPYTEGAHRGLFDGSTMLRPEGHLVVFSLKDLPRELRATGMLLALEAIRRRVIRGEPRPRMVVVDEAWQILGSGGTLAVDFLETLARSARKNYCGLVTVTQNLGDVLGSRLGEAILTNSSIQILLGAKAHDLEAVSKAFNLSEGERSFLLSCARGQGLLCLGPHRRAAIEVLSSEWEHPLVTTDPAELEQMERAP